MSEISTFQITCHLTIFKCWNTNVKLIFGLTRNTYSYLVEGHLASSFPSLRNQVLTRYAGFFRSLLNSPSWEVQFLSRVVSIDPRSITYRNLRLLTEKSGVKEPHMISTDRLQIALPNRKVPENEMWRLGLLDKLLVLREDKKHNHETTQSICAMIDSLCNT